MSATIKDFLQTARLGFIALDISRDEVSRILGEPEARMEHRRKPELWKYGNLQIAFVDGSVSLIALYFTEDKIVLPEALSIHGYIPNSNTRINDFKEYLLSENLKLETYPVLTFDEQLCLRSESGVHILFTRNRLASMQVSKDSMS